VGLRWKSVLAASLLALLLLGGCTSPQAAVETTGPKLLSVYIDGEFVGYVADPEVVTRAVQGFLWSERQRWGMWVRSASDITFVPSRDGDGPILTDASELVAERIDVVTEAAGIYVDGQPVVALRSPEEAAEALRALEDAYLAEVEARIRAERQNIRSFSIDEVTRPEKVETRPWLVHPAEVRTVEEAVAILQRGTDKVIIHVVKPGESLWSIAMANDMTVEDLRKANPEVDANPHLIRIGQELNLVVPDPYITYHSTDTVQYAKAIPFSVEVRYSAEHWPWERFVSRYGQYGEKLVSVRTIRENGRPVSREVIEEVVVRQPVSQIVVQGTRPIPDRGSGSLIWPLEGRITSGYGWRSLGFHRGVDIAANVGTPVKAADAGTVITAGWVGGYGKAVFIDHGGGKLVTVYGHNSVLKVKPGDVVSKGQVIALSGNTGRSTGPHLHFEIRVNGRAVDPVEYFKRQTLGQ